MPWVAKKKGDLSASVGHQVCIGKFKVTLTVSSFCHTLKIENFIVGYVKKKELGKKKKQVCKKEKYINTFLGVGFFLFVCLGLDFGGLVCLFVFLLVILCLVKVWSLIAPCSVPIKESGLRV